MQVFVKVDFEGLHDGGGVDEDDLLDLAVNGLVVIDLGEVAVALAVVNVDRLVTLVVFPHPLLDVFNVDFGVDLV